MNNDRIRLVVSTLSAIVIILGLMATAGLVVAHNTGPPAVPQVQTNTPAMNDIDTVGMREHAFLTALDVGDVHHEDIVALAIARRVCRYLADGGTQLGAFNIPREYGYNGYDSGFIVGAASESICKGT